MIAYLREHPLTLDADKIAVLDPAKGRWISSAQWAKAEPSFKTGGEGEDGSIIWRGISIPRIYSRVSIAGVILFAILGISYLGTGLTTGHWPGKGAPPHRNPLPETAYAPPDTSNTEAIDELKESLLRRSAKDSADSTVP